MRLQLTANVTYRRFDPFKFRCKRQCLVLMMGVLASYSTFAQDERPYEKSLLFDTTKINVDFLFGYYEQEGNHSVVTGGIGTEQLTDQDYKVVVRVPVDSTRSITFRPNVNYYTSASTDKIDSKTSASKSDFRVQLYFDYEKVNPYNRQYWKFSAGGSGESDYSSKGLQLSWTQYRKDLNASITLSGSAFFDDWVMIFPEELRTDSAILPTDDKRNSYSFATTYSGILSPRIRGSISASLTYQQGLLSTPFHRAYFTEEELPRIEKLPGHRMKFPITGQFNFFPFPQLILKLWGRQYWDDFGITSSTIRLESIGKLDTFFSLYGFYRYHNQSGSEFFGPFKSHLSTSDFYTSDFDLSTFDSHHFGAGIRWKPLNGLANFPFFKWPTQLSSFNVRFGRYYRSDGLSSYQISGALGFTLQK